MLALSALRYAVRNKGAAFPLPGSPSQSKPDGFASSPKGGALGKGGKSPRSAFGSFAAAGRKVLNRKLRGLPRPLTLGEVASRSDDGEGKPASGGAGPRFRSCFRQGCASARQCQTKCAASCQHPCPLRRFAPAPPKGEPLAKAESLRAAPSAPLAAAGRKDFKPETWRTAKASHFGRGGIAKR